MTNYRNVLAAAMLATAVCAGTAPMVHAEELKVPVGSQADRSQISLPANGMSENSVRNRWGAPADIRGPVGQPPISQWHYQNFVVYFENNRVLHSVVKQQND
ncbi:hypothetical protein [Marinobacter sp. VGCF2001]|uniref:hypothetical protein n=1 Tax=Marinobacter sp. VGCF2001 TaxID=3417189 RepID=UPI003CF8BA4A